MPGFLLYNWLLASPTRARQPAAAGVVARAWRRRGSAGIDPAAAGSARVAGEHLGRDISGRVGVSPAGFGVSPERSSNDQEGPRRKMRRSAGETPTLPESLAYAAAGFLKSP
jgi:hypothetical protein